jgi:hypothetical protein
MSKPKVFLSGGFKSNWQKVLTDQLQDRFIFFNPREHGLDDAHLYTTWDIHYVRECDFFFAYMEATNPSGYGLAFELGLAYALEKTIILIDERSPVDPTFAKYYRILHKPSGAVFSNMAEGIEFLKKFIH